MEKIQKEQLKKHNDEFTSRKESFGYNPDVCWQEFDTIEKREALGSKDLTVQGFGDLLDVNKLVTRITPEQLISLKAKHGMAKYGIQSNDTIRDVLLKTQALNSDFKELPADIREYFKNDEFLYLEFLNKNSDNKYALSELAAEITGSADFKERIELAKQKEKNDQERLLNREKSLANSIASAIKESSN